MQKLTITNKKRITAFFLVLLLVIEVMFSLSPLRVSAEGRIEHSDVLDDLKKDPEFNPEDYPADPNDYSLKVIQVAESDNGKLLVYVYNPSRETKNLEASYINMSRDPLTEKNPRNKLYGLTLLDSNGVFDKYIVNSLSVLSDVNRYYNIAAIFRSFDSSLGDTNSESIDSTQYKGYPVGCIWGVYTKDGNVVYEARKVDVVDIDIFASGSTRYFNGFKFYLSSCDSHYVAFDIGNYNVEHIFDADITFTVQTYAHTLILSSGEEHTVLKNSYTDTITLTDKEEGFNDGGGLFGKKYSWLRISDVSTFISEIEADTNETISKEEKENLLNAKFVFRYIETDYSKSIAVGSQVTQYSVVSNFGILRLHFATPESTYNLGCVSDLVGSDSDPEFNVDAGDNVQNTLEELYAKFKELRDQILKILALVFVAILLIFLVKPVINIVKFVVSILLYPFKWFKR